MLAVMVTTGGDDEDIDIGSIEIFRPTSSGLAVDDPKLRAEHAKQAKRFEAAATQAILDGLPENTYRSYRASFRSFKKWCEEKASPPVSFLPTTSSTLLGYLTACDKKDEKTGRYPCKASTLEHRLAAIVWAHSIMDIKSPVSPRVLRTMHSIKRRRLATGEEAPPRKAAPLLVDDLRQISAWVSNHRTPLVTRDLAIIALGWSCALRRSEIAALDLADITQLEETGLMLNIRRGKTDKMSKGFSMPVTAEPDAPEICPVAHLRQWLDLRGRSAGPLFWRNDWERHGARRLGGKGVASVVERLAHRAGIKTEDKDLEFSGHSLRAGFITDAAREGLPHPDIMNRSRHKTYEVFLGYVRVVQTVEKNVATGFSGWGKKKGK